MSAKESKYQRDHQEDLRCCLEVWSSRMTRVYSGPYDPPRRHVGYARGQTSYAKVQLEQGATPTAHPTQVCPGLSPSDRRSSFNDLLVC